MVRLRYEQEERCSRQPGMFREAVGGAPSTFACTWSVEQGGSKERFRIDVELSVWVWDRISAGRSQAMFETRWVLIDDMYCTRGRSRYMLNSHYFHFCIPTSLEEDVWAHFSCKGAVV